MLSVKELKGIARSMPVKEFERQLGPFVLVQRLPDEITQQKALNLGARRTVIHKAGEGAPPGGDPLPMLLEFDELMIATLPPVEIGVKLKVGRLPDCEVVIDDPSVSKHHANLEWDGKEALVEDLKSSNGTRLNGDRLHIKIIVRDGDTIAFGDAEFCFLTTRRLHARLAEGK